MNEIHENPKLMRLRRMIAGRIDAVRGQVVKVSILKLQLDQAIADWSREERRRRKERKRRG